MKNLPLFLLAGILLAAPGGAVAQTRQTRPVTPFTGLDVSGAIEVFIRPNAAPSVVVEADEALQRDIRTEVSGNVLRVYRDGSFKPSRWFRNQRAVKVFVECPELTRLAVSGASKVTTQGAFVAEAFNLRANGASEVTLQLSVKRLEMEASGASKVRITGSADRQRVQVSGASEYRGFNCVSKQAEVRASGASNAEVTAAEEVHLHASGASKVRYRGNPRVRDVQSSGASDVNAAK